MLPVPLTTSCKATAVVRVWWQLLPTSTVSTRRWPKKIAAGFGGGVGRLRMMCGAVSGIVMLVGLDCGQTEGSDSEGKSACYKVVQDLLAKSKAENGSVICAEILGIQGHEKAPNSYVASPRTAEYYKTRPCAAKVEGAARIFANYLKSKDTA